MENVISKNWYLLLIKGLIMILLAVLIFMSPANALLSYALYIGIGFVIAGAIRFFQGFQTKDSNEGWGWIVFEGIMDIIIGIVIMSNPKLTAEMLPFILGLWGAFYGFYLIVDAFSGNGNAGLKIVGGILIAILGFTIMHNPLAMGLSLTLWIGFLLLVGGIFNIIASFGLK